MAHLAYDVGLGWTGRAVASLWKVRLSLDGKVVADENLFAPHVVPCPPGEHEFAIYFYRPALGGFDGKSHTAHAPMRAFAERVAPLGGATPRFNSRARRRTLNLARFVQNPARFALDLVRYALNLARSAVSSSRPSLNLTMMTPS